MDSPDPRSLHPHHVVARPETKGKGLRKPIAGGRTTDGGAEPQRAESEQTGDRLRTKSRRWAKSGARAGLGGRGVEPQKASYEGTGRLTERADRGGVSREL